MVKSASNSGSDKKDTDSDILNVEEDTITRVNKTMKSLEEFLAIWDSSKLKAEEMLPQVAKIKEFHEVLSRWQRNAVVNKGRGTTAERIRRLEEFVGICRSYS